MSRSELLTSGTVRNVNEGTHKEVGMNPSGAEIKKDGR